MVGFEPTMSVKFLLTRQVQSTNYATLAKIRFIAAYRKLVVGSTGIAPVLDGGTPHLCTRTSQAQLERCSSLRADYAAILNGAAFIVITLSVIVETILLTTRTFLSKPVTPKLEVC